MKQKIYIQCLPRRSRMNIFVLDNDHKKNAKYHANVHVSKMTLETAQMLCTGIRICMEESGFHTHFIEKTLPKSKSGKAYRRSHPNHPCSIWARENQANFLWLCSFGYELSKEFTRRYGKVHACHSIIEQCTALSHYIPVDLLNPSVRTPFAQAMPDEYKDDDAVVAYRRYYKSKRDSGMKMVWPNDKVPFWLETEEIKSEYTIAERNSGKSREAWARARQTQLEHWLEWAWENLHNYQIRLPYHRGNFPMFDITMAFGEWESVRGTSPTNEPWSVKTIEAKHELRAMLEYMREQHFKHPKNIKRNLTNVETEHRAGRRYPFVVK